MDHLTLAFGLSDIGGGEILLIGVIALLLFGKNLPTVMRNIGKAYGQFKNTLNEAKGEFTREMDNAARELEEAKREANIEKTLGDTLRDDESKPPLETDSNAPDSYGSSTPAFTPPTRPPESIDQDAGPESLDKLSAAPAETPKPPVEPAPVLAPAATTTTASIPESTAPLPETPATAPAEPQTVAAEALKPVDPATLEQLEKKIAPPKKIPPPVA